MALTTSLAKAVKTFAERLKQLSVISEQLSTTTLAKALKSFGKSR